MTTQQPPYLSTDGRHLWNGQTWLPVSPDGSHVWDGMSWQPRSRYDPSWPTVGASGQGPRPVQWKYLIVSLVAAAQGVFAVLWGASAPNGVALVFGLLLLVCFVLAAWYSRGWTRMDGLSGRQAVVVLAVYIVGWLNFCLIGVFFGIRDAVTWHERNIRVHR